MKAKLLKRRKNYSTWMRHVPTYLRYINGFNTLTVFPSTCNKKEILGLIKERIDTWQKPPNVKFFKMISGKNAKVDNDMILIHLTLIFTWMFRIFPNAKENMINDSIFMVVMVSSAIVRLEGGTIFRVLIRFRSQTSWVLRCTIIHFIRF